MMHQPVEGDPFPEATDEEPLIFSCEIDAGDISYATNMTDEQVVAMLYAFLTQDEIKH